MNETEAHMKPVVGRDILWTSPWAVAVVVAVLVAAKLAVGWGTDLVGDEAYYTLWSFHPLQAGYYDHPPGVVWFIKAGQFLFGESAFASRVVTILATIVCALAVWRTGIALFADRTIAALATLWFTLSAGGAVGLLIVTPDAPSMMFWILAVWAAAELHRSANANWWLAFGLFAGLGLDSKYTGFFLGAGIVLWLLAYRGTRAWLRSWQLYAGGILALVLFWPVVQWNIGHDFASLQFQLGRSTEATPSLARFARYFPEYIATQAALLWPGLFLFAVAGCVLFVRNRGRRSDPAVGLLVLTAAPAIVYFAFHAMHSRVQGNWTLPLIGQLALLGAWAAVTWKPAAAWARSVWLWTRRWHAPLALLLVGVIFAQAAFAPIPVPGKLPTDDMAGWADVTDEMAAEVEKTGATSVYAIDYIMVALLETSARFHGHDIAVLPAAGYHHFTFMDVPGPNDVDWPVLFVSRNRIGSDRAATYGLLGVDGRYLSSVVRKGPGGKPVERIDFYLAGKDGL
jgi:hypothetical protein